MRKMLVLTAIMLCFSLQGESQLLKPFSASPAFSDALGKMVLDFRFNFQNLQGALVSQDGSTEAYQSNITLPGALQTVIYKYNSRQDTTASMQCVMYDGDEYKEAVKKYTETFRLVKSTRFRWIDRTLIGFNGTLEKPREDVKFASSVLRPDLQDERYKYFEIEIDFISTYAGWQVMVNLQTKKPDDEKDSG